MCTCCTRQRRKGGHKESTGQTLEKPNVKHKKTPCTTKSKPPQTGTHQDVKVEGPPRLGQRKRPSSGTQRTHATALRTQYLESSTLRAGSAQTTTERRPSAPTAPRTNTPTVESGWIDRSCMMMMMMMLMNENTTRETKHHISHFKWKRHKAQTQSRAAQRPSTSSLTILTSHVQLTRNASFPSTTRNPKKDSRD